MTTPRSFVLVHGAYHGGWCWRDVTAILAAAGHRVYMPTLTGLGERAHLMSGSINLDTHIADVVNVFKRENIVDAVLCGHSYGGWVISGALELLGGQVSSVVFLDAYVPENGEMGVDNSSNAEEIRSAVRNGKISRPKPDAAKYTAKTNNLCWLNANLTDQPIGVSLQPIRLNGARDHVAIKTYIRAKDFKHPPFDKYLNEAKEKGWRTYELNCGHDVMVDMPERLAEILREVA